MRNTQIIEGSGIKVLKLYRRKIIMHLLFNSNDTKVLITMKFLILKEAKEDVGVKKKSLFLEYKEKNVCKSVILKRNLHYWFI